MAATLSPSSPSALDDDNHHIPTATLALPSTTSASRRLPPPCWSPDETVALIDAYKDKWYSLCRGNLRANHWEEVAADVAARCPACPPKTKVQCRHKMEKLRKRYRSEIQRATAHGGVRRFTSSWVHFQSMYSMEKGPNPVPSSSSSSSSDEEDYNTNGVKRINDLYNYNKKGAYAGGLLPDSNGTATAFRIKIPGRATAGPTVAKVYSKFDEMGGPNPNSRFTNYAAGVNGASSSKISGDGYASMCQIRKRPGEMPEKNKGGDGLRELVAAIHALGEGFVRIEKAKMDMVQQVEEMRMEMDLKRTEMLLESEQRIVEAVAQAVSKRSAKRAKRNSTTPD